MKTSSGAPTTNQATGQLMTTALTPAAEGLSAHMHKAGDELGQAAVTVARTARTLLMPLEGVVWGFDRIKDWLSANVGARLDESVPEEQRVPPKLVIAGPTVNAMRYAAEEAELREMFERLLVTAMDGRRAKTAHPAFVDIIKQLAPDEAKILRVFPIQGIPLLEFRKQETESPKFGTIARNVSSIGLKADIQHKSLVPSYIDNLIRLEILTIPHGIAMSDATAYDALEKIARVDDLRVMISKQPGKKLAVARYMCELTDFGKQFCEACVWDPAKQH